MHLRVHGVPHYFHRRHLKEIDLAFDRRKLLGDTSLFLTTMQAKDPTNFGKLEKTNAMWIQARIALNQPIDSEAMARNVLDNIKRQSE